MMLGDDPFENSVIEHMSLVNKAIFQAPAPSYSKGARPHPPVEKRRERARGPDDPIPLPALARCLFTPPDLLRPLFIQRAVVAADCVYLDSMTGYHFPRC